MSVAWAFSRPCCFASLQPCVLVGTNAGLIVKFNGENASRVIYGAPPVLSPAQMVPPLPHLALRPIYGALTHCIAALHRWVALRVHPSACAAAAAAGRAGAAAGLPTGLG